MEKTVYPGNRHSRPRSGIQVQESVNVPYRTASLPGFLLKEKRRKTASSYQSFPWVVNLLRHAGVSTMFFFIVSEGCCYIEI